MPYRIKTREFPPVFSTDWKDLSVAGTHEVEYLEYDPNTPPSVSYSRWEAFYQEHMVLDRDGLYTKKYQLRHRRKVYHSEVRNDGHLYGWWEWEYKNE